MTDTRFCVCNNHEENVLHCLWSCPSLSTVWEEDPQWNFSTVSTQTGFAQQLEYVLASDCSSELFTMITRTVWLRRNKVRFSPPGFPNDQVMQRAVAALMEYRTATPSVQVAEVRTRTRWKAPPSDEFSKVNFDGGNI